MPRSSGERIFSEASLNIWHAVSKPLFWMLCLLPLHETNRSININGDVILVKFCIVNYDLRWYVDIMIPVESV